MRRRLQRLRQNLDAWQFIPSPGVRVRAFFCGAPISDPARLNPFPSKPTAAGFSSRSLVHDSIVVVPGQTCGQIFALFPERGCVQSTSRSALKVLYIRLISSRTACETALRFFVFGGV
jgi:hypothetical protein